MREGDRWTDSDGDYVEALAPDDLMKVDGTITAVVEISTGGLELPDGWGGWGAWLTPAEAREFAARVIELADEAEDA